MPGRSQTATDRWIALLLGLMLALAAGTGVPAEELVQDTWKSMVIGGFAIGTSLFVVLRQGVTVQAWRWHPILLAPLVLAAHSASSIWWSHAYLGAVELVRWLLIALLMFLAMQLPRQTLHWRVFAGVYLGATTAALWCVAQFLFGLDLFPQAVHPAATFINRNFLAEFLVTALPLGIYLCGIAKRASVAAILGGGVGLQVVALMMTGTRTALAAGAFLSVLAMAYRMGLVRSQWAETASAPTPHQAKRSNAVPPKRWAAVCTIAVVAVLGSIPTANPKLKQEFGAISALERAAGRGWSSVQGAEYREGTMAVRFALWQTTLKMIQAHPLAGVGAGAWEVAAPLHQNPDKQIETDFYAHNEVLQLVAEHGLIAWLAFSVLLWSVWEAFVRSKGKTALPSSRAAGWGLIALAIVSLGGFPLHLAGTGALAAVLAGIWVSPRARSWPDAGVSSSQPAPLSRPPALATSRWIQGTAAVLLTTSLVLGVWVAWQAARAEWYLVKAVKLATAISNSGNPRDVVWNHDKSRALALVRQGIAINPHYRKITPLIGDAAARWGDWQAAVEVWESVLASRPHVVVLMGNLARGYIATQQLDKAQKMLDRALALRPKAHNLLGLQAMVWQRTGQTPKAVELAAAELTTGQASFELAQAAVAMGAAASNLTLVEKGLQAQAGVSGPHQTITWLRLGRLYDQGPLADEAKALHAFGMARRSIPRAEWPALMAEIPQKYHPQLLQSQ